LVGKYFTLEPDIVEVPDLEHFFSSLAKLDKLHVTDVHESLTSEFKFLGQ
jgi:hypothetical protein